MKPIAFTIADDRNKPYAEMMINSFHHFHPDIEVKIYGDSEVGNKENYYRATPLFAKELIKEYDTVIKLDADQIVTGDLTHVLSELEYDMGGVINFSRTDIKTYGPVTVADVPPDQYFNCGFVVMKNKEFIDHWWDLCNSYHFPHFQYREQDLLNVLIHFGNYNIAWFDNYDSRYDYSAWHGLLSKGEWHRMVLRENKLILPKNEDRYPERDREIKVMHWAGGENAQKMNYRTTCSDEVVAFLDKLVKKDEVVEPS